MKNIEFVDFPSLQTIILGNSAFEYTFKTEIESIQDIEVT